MPKRQSMSPSERAGPGHHGSGPLLSTRPRASMGVSDRGVRGRPGGIHAGRYRGVQRPVSSLSAMPAPSMSAHRSAVSGKRPANLSADRPDLHRSASEPQRPLFGRRWAHGGLVDALRASLWSRLRRLSSHDGMTLESCPGCFGRGCLTRLSDVESSRQQDRSKRQMLLLTGR
jgi:hypothetical protein